MSVGFPNQPATTRTASNDLFAAVDIGTNSFKLTVIRTDPSSGRFLTLNRLKEPVLLGLDTTTTTASASTISAQSLVRAISAIRKFQHFLSSQRLPSPHLRLVATSAVREASNKSQFTTAVKDALGLHVDIISGTEEARLIYLGVLQFFPVFTSTVLTIDIGGGSSEFTVGFKGNVLFSKSLRLGHVTLTQQFSDVAKMREHIQNELKTSGLVEKINGFNIDVVIGSSGTIKAIDKAVCRGYALKVEENIGPFEEHVRREWRFTRDELRCLVDRLCDEDREMVGKVKREEFFKRRAAFIIAGAVLLDEIFKILAIETMDVSGYALGEGVIAEMLGHSFEGFELNTNARWRSVFRLASRFNNKKRMKAATTCLAVAREIFGGLEKWKEFRYGGSHEDGLLATLDDRNLEYLDAACLLHNIGLYAGKKGYHKQSYHLILNGDHLHGYSGEETKVWCFLESFMEIEFFKVFNFSDSFKLPAYSNACKAEIQNPLYNYAGLLCSSAMSSSEFSVRGIFMFS
ncbi:Guanosine-5'-triphosphate,3'-diphosphate pyrophosphatase [Striga asiatica]|uniref:Guanosine-5'-triphosphate,3'-diphosphate pyrophosphatase n=1 Tax=Striga asiatica TaxID=4170 RepID=A0A5A7QWX2_STRAF|nr:Guanosine-5'-triphosphate,3'-diphosphate pyrophosphatase [Striga asiatica]